MIIDDGNPDHHGGWRVDRIHAGARVNLETP
jgi:hypothetical protein